jgi:hypothetical protein
MKLRSIIKNIVVQGRVTMDLVSRLLDAAVLKDELDEKLSGITTQKSEPGPIGPTGATGATGAPGAIGATGATGATGAAGSDGKTIRNGVGTPSGGLGVDGDFYIDTSTEEIYGPKTAGAWGSPTSLVGPAGADSGTAFKYFSNTAGSTVSGSTANAILTSNLIPANTFGVGSMFDYNVRNVRNTGGGGFTVRIYTNTTNSLSGATLWRTFSAGTGVSSVQMVGDVVVVSGTNTELSGATSGTAAATSVNVNWAVNQYFIVAIQPNNTTDIHTNKLVSIHPRN